MPLTITIRDIVKAVGAQVLCGEEALDREVNVVIASDLVSDILCCRDEGPFLITGLAKIQILRAAEVLDLIGICFVRGKEPEPAVLDYAAEMGLPVLSTPKTMYETSGLVYRLGGKSGVYSPPGRPD
ncbi:MAG TPA: DRTGG domain-containing protein [bacterium]|nr:DRTGG domain-containing protein [bacterium]